MAAIAGTTKLTLITTIGAIERLGDLKLKEIIL